jgi:hypothetical protein
VELAYQKAYILARAAADEHSVKYTPDNGCVVTVRDFRKKLFTPINRDIADRPGLDHTDFATSPMEVVAQEI